MQRIAIFALIMMLFSCPPLLAGDFTLSSPELTDRQAMKAEQVLNGFGCQGGNLSPALSWRNPPQGTKSFAVTVYDPDAPTGSGWWHWVIFNIPAKVNSMAKDAGNLKSGFAPPGSVQSRTDFSVPGYGGACPPVGDPPHRYVFSVYALDVDTLDLGQEATAAMVGFTINRHRLAKASLTVFYGR
jgi:Raf kinase inhibitor-like YbhB/YbcL family protein